MQLAGVRQQSMLLCCRELPELPCKENAFLLIEDDLIAEYDTMYELEI